ncbi:MAG: M48 family metalloprotease [Polyangiales bacterium]
MNHDVIVQARAALPAWATWGGVFAMPLVAALSSWLIARVTLWIATPSARPVAQPAPIAPTKTPFRDPYADTSVHWMERARIAYGPRWLASANLLLLPLLFGILSFVFGGPLTPGGQVVRALLTGAAAFVGPFTVRVAHESRLRRVDWSYGFWLRSHLTAMLLMASHVVVVALVAMTMPATLDTRAIVTVALTLPVLVALGLGGGIVALKSVGLLRAAPERLRRVVDVAAARTGRTPREVLVAPLATVNVYSYPAVGRVVISEASLEALDDDALAAMLGHALAHLSESTRRSIARGFTAPLVFVPLMLTRPLAQHGFVTFYAALLATFVAVAILNRTLRYDFKTADKIAREAEGDAGTYARALAKVYEANVVPAVLHQKNPARAHLYDRMVDAGMTPDLPRPAPPRMGRAALAFMLTVFASVAVMGVAMSFVANARPDDETGRLAVVALTGGDGPVLGDLALDAWRRHDVDASVALYRVAMESSPRDVYLAANLAIVLGDARRCAESARAFDEASHRRARHELRGEDSDAERAIVESASVAVQQCLATVGP